MITVILERMSELANRVLEFIIICCVGRHEKTVLNCRMRNLFISWNWRFFKTVRSNKTSNFEFVLSKASLLWECNQSEWVYLYWGFTQIKLLENLMKLKSSSSVTWAEKIFRLFKLDWNLNSSSEQHEVMHSHGNLVVALHGVNTLQHSINKHSLKAQHFLLMKPESPKLVQQKALIWNSP